RQAVFPGRHVGGAAVEDDVPEGAFLLRRDIPKSAPEIGPERRDTAVFAAARPELGEMAKRAALEKYRSAPRLLVGQWRTVGMMDRRGSWGGSSLAPLRRHERRAGDQKRCSQTCSQAYPSNPRMRHNTFRAKRINCRRQVSANLWLPSFASQGSGGVAWEPDRYVACLHRELH